MLSRDPRTEQGAHDADLVILERTEIVFREGDPPLIKVIVCARSEDGPHPETVNRSLTVRSSEGKWTDEYSAIRQGFLP
ncbi:MAG: hypothetical protein ACJA00_005695 [Myxococcota bacterium]|jgi:hypothetical protein